MPGIRHAKGCWVGAWTAAAVGVAVAATLLASGGPTASRGHAARTVSTPTRPARAQPRATASTRRPLALPPSLRGAEWTRLPTTRRIVALTFDAGGNDAGIPAILSALGSTATPATFFLTGHWAQYYPSVARRIAARYPVGDHTWTHPDLTTLSDRRVREQVLAGARLIRAAARSDTRPLFRFPYGARDARTIGLVNALGYGSIRWTVDTLGWMGTSGGQSVGSVVSRVLASLRPGEIVLMHVGSNPQDNSTLDASALRAVINEIRRRGYSFVTVPQFIQSISRRAAG